ncbi:MAG: endonuclease NucS [Syntrophorhabdaceae bacterium]|nr:endonuclease NucS [Syntrophorhabdaceae bacterium]
MSGRTYYFPFRLYLKPLREFAEPMVRAEFAYVAENLLLRGGYRKTHFQADQTTLQSVSQMGGIYNKPIEEFSINKDGLFTPFLTWNKNLVSPPEVFYFQEFILQTIIRQWLSEKRNLQILFDYYNHKNKLQAKDFEVLGEKALPEGHVDILIKDAVPTGFSRKIVIETKLNKALIKDIAQIKSYIEELGDECIGGFLIAKDFPKKALQLLNHKVKCLIYFFNKIDNNKKYSIDELSSKIQILPL